MQRATDRQRANLIHTLARYFSAQPADVAQPVLDSLPDAFKPKPHHTLQTLQPQEPSFSSNDAGGPNRELLSLHFAPLDLRIGTDNQYSFSFGSHFIGAAGGITLRNIAELYLSMCAFFPCL